MQIASPSFTHYRIPTELWEMLNRLKNGNADEMNSPLLSGIVADWIEDHTDQIIPTTEVAEAAERLALFVARLRSRFDSLTHSFGA